MPTGAGRFAGHRTQDREVVALSPACGEDDLRRARPEHLANLLALRNTRIGNLMGLSALSLPTDQPSCGLMLLGAPNTEAQLLRLGAAIAPLVQG